MKRLYFIYNAGAGKALVKDRLCDILDMFTKAGYEVTVHPTQAARDAVSAAGYACAEEYDLLVCAGGDGTLNECIEGVMNSYTPVPIGYIPAGSTNDFAKSLGVPRGILNAVQWILDGSPVACDIGSFNDRFFTYIVAFGAFTNVSYETSQALKNKIGHSAYLFSGVMSLNTIKDYRLRIEHCDTVFEDEFAYGMVSNTSSIGGLFSMSDFKLDDGIFEVTLIKRPTNPIQLQRALSFLISKDKNEANTDCVTYFRTSSIKITSLDETPVTWTIDGENGGNSKTNSISNNHKAVVFMIGPQSPKKVSNFSDITPITDTDLDLDDEI